MTFLPGFETEQDFINFLGADRGSQTCSELERRTEAPEVKQHGHIENVSNDKPSTESLIADDGTDDATLQLQRCEDNTSVSELDLPDWSTFESTLANPVGIQQDVVETRTRVPSQKRKRDEQDGAAVDVQELGLSGNFEQHPERNPATATAGVHHGAPTINIHEQEQHAGKKRKGLATPHRIAVKGEVRERFGILQLRDAHNAIWRNAGYHNDYRAEFIEMDRAEHTPYVYQPQRGNAEYDVTSFCSSNSTWTPDKETVCDTQGRKVLCLLEQPEDLHSQEPRMWIHHGLVMLDKDNHPLREFEHVPRTLSSEIEGWRMEGLRRTTGMGIADLIARMPTFRKRSDGQVEQLQTMAAFTNRMMRWRKDNGVPVWKETAGSKSTNEYPLQKRHVPSSEATSTGGYSGFSSEQCREVREDQSSSRSRYELSDQEAVHSNIDNVAPSKKRKRQGTFDENEESVIRKKQRMQPQMPMPTVGFNSAADSAKNKRKASSDEPEGFPHQKKRKLQSQSPQLPPPTKNRTLRKFVPGRFGPPSSKDVALLSTTKNKQTEESLFIDLDDFGAVYRSGSTPQGHERSDQARQRTYLRDEEEEETGKMTADSTSADGNPYQDYSRPTEDPDFGPNRHHFSANVGPSMPTFGRQGTQASQYCDTYEVAISRDSENTAHMNLPMAPLSHLEKSTALGPQSGSLQTDALQYPDQHGSYSSEVSSSHRFLPPTMPATYGPQVSRCITDNVLLPKDYRSYKPCNDKEADSIHAALEYTRVSFIKWHEVDPPATSRFESYQAQFEELQAVHESLWQFEESVTRLIGLGYWTSTRILK